jgi:hypothetical protein
MDPVYDQYKSNVFTLGMIILKVGLLRNMNEIYNYKLAEMNHSKLNSYINEFSTRYSPNITNILKLCLVKDHNERKDFI